MGRTFITHDLAVAAGLADNVAVMRHGEVGEAGPTAQVFRTLHHPYTRQLLAASSHVPPRDPSLPGGEPVLVVDNLVRDYRIPARHLFAPSGAFRAVDGVSFRIERGENVGLVGESGSGKSTLARAIMALESAQGGAILFVGVALDDRDLRTRRKLQVVFQAPYGSIAPRQRVDTL